MDPTPLFPPHHPHHPSTTRSQTILDQSLPTPLASLENIVLSIKKSDTAKRAAQKFCFQNNLDFKMINPISEKIDLLLKVDHEGDSDPGSQSRRGSTMMKHIDVVGSDENKDTWNTGRPPNKPQTPQHKPKQLNAGVLIYQRNRRLTELTLLRNKSLKSALEAEQSKLLTFKPEINLLSKIVISQIQQNEGRQQFYERRKQERISKISYLEEVKQKEEMKECSFKPRTNDTEGRSRLMECSSSFFEASSTQMGVNEQHLRNLSRPKVKGSANEERSFSFHPKVNPVSEMIVNGTTFEERQQKYEIQKLMKQSKSKQNLSTTHPSQLQPSHHSLRTSRHLLSRRNLQNLPIGQYLYNQRHTNPKILSSTTATPPPPTNPKSSEIYEHTKFRSFYQIFKALDTNQDSIISPSKLETQGLPEGILVLIAPLLAEMEDMGIELNEEEFVEALDKLYSTLSVAERSNFIKLGRSQGKTSGEQKYPFKPRIDEKSSILAGKVRDFGSPGISLYNFCQQRKSLLDKKLQTKRQEKESAETSLCTFKPTINK